MKRNLIVPLCFLFALVAHAQTSTVEKSIFGIQAGFLGVWMNNESRLSPGISLRTEIGFDSEIFGGIFYEKTGFIMAPVLTLEPRLYYNLEKRNSNSKDIKNNSGNFLGIKISYSPDWFLISNYDDVKIVDQVSVIPKWGIRRTFQTHFNFEAGGGVGYRYYFANPAAGYPTGEGEPTLDLHLRIGYRF